MSSNTRAFRPTEAPEYRLLLPEVVPLLETGERVRAPGALPERRRVDEYLLELILMDTLARADSRRAATAEDLIERSIPEAYYERVMDRYDAMSDDSDDESHLLEPWLARAALKSSQWKAKMIWRFLYIVTIEERIGNQAINEVISLALAMDAGPECQQMLRIMLAPASSPA